MRRSVLLFMLLMATAAARADFLFWLDSATRNNAHDPRSPLYRAPTAVVHAPTGTPTPSATPVLATPTITPTVSDTATGTPTPTATITALVFYDGDTAGATLDGVNRAPYQYWYYGLGTDTQIAAGGVGGSAYLSLTMAAATFIVEGVQVSATAYVDVGAYTALSLWMRSPSGCFPPMVTLVSPGGGSAAVSASVTFTAYTDAGAMLAGQWQHAVIPLSAFDGVNVNGQAYSLAAHASQVSAVVVMPAACAYSYNSMVGYYLFPYDGWTGGTEDVDMDGVVFVNQDAGPAGRLPRTFDPFVSNDGVTAWGTQWGTYTDSLACLTPTTSLSFPTAGVPVENATGTTLSACFAGRIAGVLGASAGLTPCGATDVSMAGMVAGVLPSAGPVDLDSLAGLPKTAGHVRGLGLYMKRGPGDPGNTDYVVTVLKDSVTHPLAHYSHLVPASALAGGDWVWIAADFPAVGVQGTDQAGSFGQPAWAAAGGYGVAWSATDVIGLRVSPADSARGQSFDVLVDHIQFY